MMIPCFFWCNDFDLGKLKNHTIFFYMFEIWGNILEIL